MSTFEAIAARLVADPDVEERTAFTSPGLRVGGKIFAMLVRDELVVKLPAERCAELVATGAGRPFRSGGRSMREWVSVGRSPELEWSSLADEALAFVRR